VGIARCGRPAGLDELANINWVHYVSIRKKQIVVISIYGAPLARKVAYLDYYYFAPLLNDFP